MRVHFFYSTSRLTSGLPHLEQEEDWQRFQIWNGKVDIGWVQVEVYVDGKNRDN